jgi:hypothetical protein
MVFVKFGMVFVKFVTLAYDGTYRTRSSSFPIFKFTYAFYPDLDDLNSKIQIRIPCISECLLY